MRKTFDLVQVQTIRRTYQVSGETELQARTVLEEYCKCLGRNEAAKLKNEKTYIEVFCLGESRTD
jgi:hypothetical protein